MDAALVTGMFNVGFSGMNTLSKDVGTTKDSNFNDVFSKKLEEKKGFETEKENIKTKDVSSKKDDDIKTEENIKEEGKIEKDSTKEKDETVKKTEDKKDEEIKVTDKINGLVENIMTQVNDIDVKNLDELKEVIKGISENLEEVEQIELSKEEMLKLQEELKLRLEQKVDEVGPQIVETEKITFNKYDELEKNLDSLSEKLGVSDVDVEEVKVGEEVLNNTEMLSSDFSQSFESETQLESKSGNNEEKKFNVTDFRKKSIVDNDVDKLDFNIEDVKTEISNIENTPDVFEVKTVNMQEQIDIIKQVAEKVDVNLFEDKSEMIIKLKPDNLGKVTVEIAVENGSVTAKFLAESEKVKEILESNMQDLKDHLAKQGMNIQDLSVSVGNQNKESLFEQRNYIANRRRRKIEEVSNNGYSVNENFEQNRLNESIYWPDSTVSFSA